MRTIAAAIACTFIAFALPAEARGSKGGSRPSYSGSKHTSSHGGSYAGGSGSSHNGGSYRINEPTTPIEYEDDTDGTKMVILLLSQKTTGIQR